MAYCVSLVQGRPDFTTLPVVKITEYPLAKGIYQPYAHGAVCVAEDKFCLRLLSFEAVSIADSRILAAFGTQDREELLLVCCEEGAGQVFCLKNGEKTPLNCELQFFRGEDLQGKYWGAQVHIPLNELAEIFPEKSLQKGARLLGNYYKVCEKEPYIHYGSAYPCRFGEGDFIRRDMMAEFIVADY